MRNVGMCKNCSWGIISRYMVTDSMSKGRFVGFWMKWGCPGIACPTSFCKIMEALFLQHLLAITSMSSEIRIQKQWGKQSMRNVKVFTRTKILAVLTLNRGGGVVVWGVWTQVPYQICGSCYMWLFDVTFFFFLLSSSILDQPTCGHVAFIL